MEYSIPTLCAALMSHKTSRLHVVPVQAHACTTDAPDELRLVPVRLSGGQSLLASHLLVAGYDDRRGAPTSTRPDCTVLFGYGRTTATATRCSVRFWRLPTMARKLRTGAELCPPTERARLPKSCRSVYCMYSTVSGTSPWDIPGHGKISSQNRSGVDLPRYSPRRATLFHLGTVPYSLLAEPSSVPNTMSLIIESGLVFRLCGDHRRRGKMGHPLHFKSLNGGVPLPAAQTTRVEGICTLHLFCLPGLLLAPPCSS